MKIRRAVIKGVGQATIEQAEIADAPGAGEVLIETEASFISAGTELSGYVGLNPGRPEPGPPTYPLNTGYLNAGRVLRLGEAVEGFAAGDRVMSFGPHASRHYQRPERGVVVRIPEEIVQDTASASWLAGIALTALQASTVSLNDWVAVFGLGLVGNLAAQLFQLSGAKVVGIDPVASRRELARKVGIANTLGGTLNEVAEGVRALCGAEGARISVEAVGHASVAEQAAALTASHGELILLGTERADYQTDLTKIMRHVHWRWVEIKGAQVWRIPLHPGRGVKHSNYGNALLVFDLIKSGRLKMAELISHRMRPDQIKDAYDLLLNDKEHCWGVVLDWRA